MMTKQEVLNWLAAYGRWPSINSNNPREQLAAVYVGRYSEGGEEHDPKFVTRAHQTLLLKKITQDIENDKIL